jgi:hypothetical protein
LATDFNNYFSTEILNISFDFTAPNKQNLLSQLHLARVYIVSMRGYYLVCGVAHTSKLLREVPIRKELNAGALPHTSVSPPLKVVKKTLGLSDFLRWPLNRDRTAH